MATCYLLGVSTRGMDKLVRTLGVTGLYKSQVSVMARDLDEQVAALRTRPLHEGPFTFVAADVLTMKVREAGRVVKVSVMVATGVNADGHREVLGIHTATTESSASWLSFLLDLTALRSVSGRSSGGEEISARDIQPAALTHNSAPKGVLYENVIGCADVADVAGWSSGLARGCQGGTMYGLVNQAIEDLAVQLGGPDLWATIVERAGIEVPIFATMEAYDDAVTYHLVESASAVLGLSQSQVLEAFGDHWIRYTGNNGYGPLLAAMGNTLPQFLRNLDTMHSRIALNMPALRPPSFDCEELDEGHMLLRYWSERPGLAPMVAGLLKGLGSRFDLYVTVTLAEPRPEGMDHDVFLVTYTPCGSGVDPAEVTDEASA